MKKTIVLKDYDGYTLGVFASFAAVRKTYLGCIIYQDKELTSVYHVHYKGRFWFAQYHEVVYA